MASRAGKKTKATHRQTSLNSCWCLAACRLDHWLRFILVAVQVQIVSQPIVFVLVLVADSGTLPCNGTAYVGVPVQQSHILWQTADRRVFEFSAGRVRPGAGFEGRSEMSSEKIRQGDFSLTIHNISFSDEDTYECYWEADKEHFLGSVPLFVEAHRYNLTLQSRANLTLLLHSSAPVEVLFTPAGSAEPPRFLLNNTGRPGPGYEHRVSVQSGSLTLRSLTAADQGNYTVRDCSTDRTISTVSVSVEAHSDSLILPPGANLTLRLFTAEPVEVLFAAAGEGASVSVCAVERGAASRPGPGYEHRVSVQNGSLTLRSLTAADQGQYTVRDLQGHTISTVSVLVEDAGATRTQNYYFILLLLLPLAAVLGVLYRKREVKTQEYELQGRRCVEDITL
ncbi:CD276 protein, partial [Amia calva]|nr:CD276 protein [Amia calva]